MGSEVDPADDGTDVILACVLCHQTRQHDDDDDDDDDEVMLNVLRCQLTY